MSRTRAVVLGLLPIPPPARELGAIWIKLTTHTGVQDRPVDRVIIFNTWYTKQYYHTGARSILESVI